ncbi:hypothetical protein [Methylobacterium radiotolerans]|uniref:hypothetical protein n=1 Tax=Methylobacterium radiotolerans TaxID=31998 RepID=UPI0003FD1A60|nr:hypothetical protein [Methylobacterium radiotolerans]
MTFALTPVDPDSRRGRPRDAGSSIGRGRKRIRTPPGVPIRPPFYGAAAAATRA